MSFVTGMFCSLHSSSSYSAFLPLYPLNGRKMKRRKTMKQDFVFGLRTVECKGVDFVSTSYDRKSVLANEDRNFKSSFDEYLKAMESVKVVREKNRSSQPVKGENAKKKLSVKSSTVDERKEKVMKTRKFEVKELNGREYLSKGGDAAGKQRLSDGKLGRQGAVDRKFPSRGGSTEEGNWRSDFKESQNIDPIRNVIQSNGRVDRDVSGRRLKEEDIDLKAAAFVNDNALDNRPVSRRDMEERIQKLAKSLNGADIDMPEWKFSKTMQNAKIRFSDHSILRVIQILGKLGNWRRVLQVIDWLQSRERFRSHKLRYIYTAAIDALQKSKRPVEALNVFRVMLESNSSYPDIVSYHSIAVTLGQAGYMKELFDVIDSMRSMPKKFKIGGFEKWDPRLQPDIVIYHAVLNACVKRKQWDGAFWVLQQLKEAGQKPTGTTYGLVMEVMLACGKYNLVHEFFRKAQRSAIPNALTYRVLVNAFWREGKIDDAVATVKDMEKRGIVGSASIYYDMARCLCSAGRCREALIQVEKLCNVASKPLVVTYTGLVQACLDSGNVQDGVYIFSHMKKYCSPNLVTYNILLKALVEHGMFDEAKELFQSMPASGETKDRLNDKNVVSPDVYTYNTVLEGCIRSEKWDDFVYAYEQMLQNGYHFNSKRHLSMVLHASRAGKINVVETTWKHLVEMGRTPPPALFKERFFLHLEKGNISAALASLSCYPSSSTSEVAFSEEAWFRLLKDNMNRFRKGVFQQLVEAVDDSQSDVLLNLVASCRQLIRTDMASLGQSQTENFCDRYV